MRIIAIALMAALLIAGPNALAQNKDPHAANSGAGVPGLPGNKSGPAIEPSGKTHTESTAQSQDQSKVPGLPGSKSGPAQRPK
jgi:hypothetical protein